MKGATLEHVHLAHPDAQPAEAAPRAAATQPAAAEGAAQVTNGFEHFVTPEWIIEAALNLIPQSPAPSLVIDAGAGTGVWGRVARRQWGNGVWVEGIEVDENRTRTDDYNTWQKVDFLSDFWPWGHKADVVMSNPPFSLAELFVRQGLDLAHPDGGRVVMLLRLAFLEGQARGKGLWRETPLEHVAVLSARPSFTGNGKTDSKTAYAIFVWRNGYAGQPTISWVHPPLERAA